ncbi:MAG: collagen-like protein [Bacilli bacterium]|nr:collagen-like protein [Bacilli bacterium]
MPILKVKKDNGEWLDILAIKGEKGDQGPQGLQGPQGPQGIQGIQGLQGNDGHSPEKYIDYYTKEDLENLDNIYIHKYISLISVSDTPPASFFLGDKYLNTEDKCIYTAIDSEHWSDSSEPIKTNVFYIDESTGCLYYYHNESINKLYGNIILDTKICLNSIGNLNEITTRNKENLVGAINEINDKSYIITYLSKKQSISSGYNNVVFDSYEKEGNYFKFDKENSRLEVLEDCIALVSGSVFVDGSLGEGYVWSHIFINNLEKQVEATSHLERIINRDYTHTSIPTKAVKLKKGDIVSMRVDYACDQGIISLRNGSSNTFLSVVKI